MNIIPYNMESISAKALAKALGVKRLRKTGTPVKRKVINWGCSHIERAIKGEILNKPEAVALAANKLQAFKTLSGHVPIPAFTEERLEASRWLAEGVCKTVLCRTLLSSHSGKGIVIAEKVEDIVDAPLYVKYIPKIREYRIHVCNGKAFHIQQKKAKEGGLPNWKIRNHANGFVFAKEQVEIGEEALELAIIAVKTLELDFGAVDVIYNAYQKEYFVLEVNTAPGVEGTTLQKYVEVFNE